MSGYCGVDGTGITPRVTLYYGNEKIRVNTISLIKDTWIWSFGHGYRGDNTGKQVYKRR